MKREEIIKNLEEGNFDLFGEELLAEKQMFPQGYETIKEMVADQGALNMSRFLIEDFPDRFEF